MVILAIESTCDETGAAIVRGDEKGVEVVANVVASSIELVKKYGGVVPEVAAREQVAVIIPVIKECLEKSGITKDDIDAIAVTKGPGLMGSLLVGTETAKVLALSWKKPLIAVNHMAGHLAANWLTDKVPVLPAVGLIVSGGHTDLYFMKDLKNWQWIGGTRDDAAGEAFDKAARIMGLPYPGGPAIQKAANLANKSRYKLPRPMIHDDNLEMSFSGLKTALARVVSETEKLEVGELAFEFSSAVAEILVVKLCKAVDKYQPRSVLVAGGVAANTTLRSALEQRVGELGLPLFIPEFKYCTDNAAMVGAAAILRPDYVELAELRPDPGLEL